MLPPPLLLLLYVRHRSPRASSRTSQCVKYLVIDVPHSPCPEIEFSNRGIATCSCMHESAVRIPYLGGGVLYSKPHITHGYVKHALCKFGRANRRLRSIRECEPDLCTILWYSKIYLYGAWVSLELSVFPLLVCARHQGTSIRQAFCILVILSCLFDSGYCFVEQIRLFWFEFKREPWSV